MTPNQARNVVALLQREPLYYRNFGVYWWHIKAELKRLGFDQDQLFHLGDFVDPVVAPLYAGRSARALTDAAFEYQADHTFHKYNSDTHHDAILGVYVVHDEDAE